MSKKRASLKYGAAGVATGLYAVAAATAYKDRAKPDVAPVNYQKVAIAAATMTALTWIAAWA